MRAVEAIDSSTTLCSCFEKGRFSKPFWLCLYPGGVDPAAAAFVLVHTPDCMRVVTPFVRIVLVVGKKIAPQNPFAPILVMLLAGCGGAVWRYVERRERGLQPQAEWLNRSGAVHRILVYGAIYGFLRERQGVEFARLFLVAVHTLKEIYEGKDHACL
jgi:hypothetical protein